MDKYWVYLEGQVLGPFDLSHLMEMPGFGPSSLVCPEGRAGDMSGDWSKASSLASLADLFPEEASAPARGEAAQAAGGDISTDPKIVMGTLPPSTSSDLREAQNRIHELEDAVRRLRDELAERDRHAQSLQQGSEEKLRNLDALQAKISEVEKRVEELPKIKEELQQTEEALHHTQEELDHAKEELHEAVDELHHHEERHPDAPPAAEAPPPGPVKPADEREPAESPLSETIDKEAKEAAEPSSPAAPAPSPPAPNPAAGMEADELEPPPAKSGSRMAEMMATGLQKEDQAPPTPTEVPESPLGPPPTLDAPEPAPAAASPTPEDLQDLSLPPDVPPPSADAPPPAPEAPPEPAFIPLVKDGVVKKPSKPAAARGSRKGRLLRLFAFAWLALMAAVGGLYYMKRSAPPADSGTPAQEQALAGKEVLPDIPQEPAEVDRKEVAKSFLREHPLPRFGTTLGEKLDSLRGAPTGQPSRLSPWWIQQQTENRYLIDFFTNQLDPATDSDVVYQFAVDLEARTVEGLNAEAKTLLSPPGTGPETPAPKTRSPKRSRKPSKTKPRSAKKRRSRPSSPAPKDPFADELPAGAGKEGEEPEFILPGIPNPNR